MLAVVSAVALVLVSSGLLGTAILALTGGRTGGPLAAPVGFAALLTVAGICIHLPGGATSCEAVLLVLLLIALGCVAFRRAHPAGWTVALAAVALLLAMIPFAAEGRAGLLGVGINDDMSEHLLAAWTLQGHAALGSDKLISSGYPIAPHALAAVISKATGISLEHAFTGLILAVPALLALAAAAVIPNSSRSARSLAGLAVGFCYLQAAYLVQASFKEPIEALILVAFVAALGGLDRARTTNRLSLVPLAVLAASSVYVNSYLGVLWPGGTLLVLAVAHTALARRRRVALIAQLRPWASALGIGGTAFVLLILPELSRMISFSHSAYNQEGSTVFGDLLHRLPPLEGVGIWPRLDFRFDVPLASIGGVLGLIAVGALVASLVRSARRGDFILPSALLMSAIVFAATSSGSPYTAAKALTIAAPLVTLILVRELLVLWRTGRRMISPERLSATVIGVLLIVGAYSDLEVLRDGPVGPASHSGQLASFRRTIGRDPTLFLGADDYVHWELRGADVATPPEPLYASAVVPLRHGKAQPDPSGRTGRSAATSSRFAGVGLAFDFDSVPTAWLDRFTYAILPRSGYADPAPANWQLVRSTASYQLWRRVGQTLPYQTLDAIDNPGAFLRCGAPAGRALASQTGIALTEPPPVVGPRAAWRGAVGYAGRSAHQALHLGTGSWLISLQYDSVEPISVTAAGLRAVLPANLEPLGPDWYAGTLHLARPARVRVTVRYHSLPYLGRVLGAFGLTRAPAPTGIEPLGRVTASRPSSDDRLIPLSRACGRYVDRYRLT